MISTSSPPPARVPLAGEASYHGRTLAFDVTGARPLSLEVRLRSALGSHDGALFEDVHVHTGLEPAALGRCRFTPAPTGDPASGLLTPLDAPLKCAELLSHGRLSRLDQGFDSVSLVLQRREQIRPELRAYAADLVYELAIYRALFDEIDAALQHESADVREELTRSVLQTRGRAFIELFDRRLADLAAIVREFTRGEHERHGFYFRRQVWSFLLASPFLARTNLRPRGYAGDSQMMRYIYANAYEGASTFGRLLHKHPAESVAAQAVRNRRAMIVEQVERAYARRVDTTRPLRLLSVACGPAWEVRDLFARASDCERFECALLDQDDEALGEAEEAIAQVALRVGATPRVRYLRDSVRTMIATSDLRARFGAHDFIYSMGLFDYLTEPVARRVLARLYAILEPGGTLLIGNFHPQNPTRIYMEYWMDWVLLYRTERELLGLAGDLPNAQAEVFFEQTKSQMFLRVCKPSR